ncbi:MAG: VWA domain-containing protein [Pseudomonadota bacterium]
MTKVTMGAALAAALLVSAAAVAEPSCTTDAIVVFDGSASMNELRQGQEGERRIVLAREAMRRTMPEIALSRRLGLVIYGPGIQQESCDNVDLRFPPIWNAAPRIIGDVDALEPNGNTPLTAAVRTAAEALEFDYRPGVIVLVTDGRETCGQSPCALGTEIAARAANMTVHVIGFQLQTDYIGHPSFRPANVTFKADCLARKTGGRVVTTETVEELVAALRKTLACPLFSLLKQSGSDGPER